MHNTLYNLLTEDYSIQLATNEKDFEIIKDIRKEVFAPKYNLSVKTLEEKGYLFSEDDTQSFNYLLRHNASNTYVGTVRLFFINNKTPTTQLPMQKDGNVDDIDHFTQERPICEISRLALSNHLPKHPSFSTLKLRTSLSLGLMIATRINYFLYHYTRVFSVMEYSLERILKRQNVHFKEVGKATEYYGIRIPFAIEREKLIRDTEINMGKITRHYLQKLCKNPESFWHFIDNNPYLERSDIELERLSTLFQTHGDDVSLELLLGHSTKTI